MFCCDGNVDHAEADWLDAAGGPLDAGRRDTPMILLYY
jgi:hypothetical protein